MPHLRRVPGMHRAVLVPHPAVHELGRNTQLLHERPLGYVGPCSSPECVKSSWLNPDHLGDARHTPRVQGEQHVVAGQGDAGVGRDGQRGSRRVTAVGASAIRRWSVLTVWVAVPKRTSENPVTARSVATVMLAPFAARRGRGRDHRAGRRRAVGVEQVRRREDLAVEVVGRAAGAAQAAAAGEDPRRRAAAEPRCGTSAGTAADAIGVNVSVAGSHISALSTAVLSENGTGKFCPPNTTTLPSGSTTLLWKARAFAIGRDLARLVTVVPLMVTTYALAVALDVLVRRRAADREDLAGVVHDRVAVHRVLVVGRGVPAGGDAAVAGGAYQFIALLGPACSTRPPVQANSQAWLSAR